MAWLNRLLDRGTVLGLVFAGLAFAAFRLADAVYDVALRDPQYFNGWVLIVGLVLLMLLSLRKRVVTLPFGRVRAWLVLHIYLGLVCLGVFLVHTGFRLPDAPLEWLLWSLFVLVGASGLAGAALNKFAPARMEAHGERFIFERIPVFRARLAAEAEALALESVSDGDTVSIAGLYASRLASYFARPHNMLAHLMSSKLPLNRALGDLDSIERYLDDAGRARLARLRELVIAKDNLDFQHANGALLKLWLFLHVPASWAMLLVIVFHVVIAYAFSTGIA